MVSVIRGTLPDRDPLNPSPAQVPTTARSDSPEHQSMALRSKTMTTNAPEPDEPVLAPVSQRARPDIGQFRLQVDRQTKASFTTYEAAEEVGLQIKKGHPIVRVTVYDSVEGTNRLIEVPTV